MRIRAVCVFYVWFSPVKPLPQYPKMDTWFQGTCRKTKPNENVIKCCKCWKVAVLNQATPCHVSLIARIGFLPLFHVLGTTTSKQSADHHTVCVCDDPAACSCFNIHPAYSNIFVARFFLLSSISLCFLIYAFLNLLLICSPTLHSHNFSQSIWQSRVQPFLD